MAKATPPAKTAGKKSPGRPRHEPIERVGPDYVTKTPEDLAQAEAEWREQQGEEAKALAVIDERFGDNLPYDLHRLEAEARFYLQESAVAMLEAGHRLILIKEHEEHGSFTASLERIGIDPRAARRMMQAAVKFSDPKRRTFAALGKAKMLELMVEDEDDLDALAEGGTIAGLTLDDVDKMSCRELKDTLRKARAKAKEEAEVQERLLESKDKKINELEKELRQRTTRVKTWDGNFDEVTTNIQNFTTAARAALIGLNQQIQAILDVAGEHNAPDEQITALVEPFQLQIQTLEAEFDEVRANFEFNFLGYIPQRPGLSLLAHRLQIEGVAQADEELAEGQEG